MTRIKKINKSGQPCRNKKCDNEETTAVAKFNNTTFYLCEKCGRQFSYCDQGFATQEEIERLQQDQFQQGMRKGKYEPYRITVGRKLAKQKAKKKVG